MKPVSLNQLLFHPKTACLSFYLSPQTENFDAFVEDMLSQLRLQDLNAVAKVLERSTASIKKILKNHPEKSYGFFIADDLEGYLALDQRPETFCIIGQTFHVRPVLEELFVNPEYMVVNVSLYDIKIFRGDFHHIEIIHQYEFDQLPKSISDSRIFAPQYMGLVPYKTILAIKTIAQKIKDLVLYQSLPVIVTGLEEIKSIFMRYFNDTTGVISHFQEDFYEKSCMEILEKCKNFRFAVLDYYSAQLKERLKRLMKSRKLIWDLPDVIKATTSGRVGHLVIPIEQKLWGKIDLETGEYVIHKKITKTSIDILNELAEEVIRQGGRIQFLGPHFFPGEATVLAILKGQQA